MGFDTLKDTRYKRNAERNNYEKGKIPLLANEDDSGDDEELFERSKNAARLNSDKKISKVKNELDGAINVMRDNLGKVLDRGERLEDLESKSESFEMNAFNFKSQSTKLRNRLWWQNCKSKMVLGLIILGIIIIIIVSVVIKNKNKKS